MKMTNPNRRWCITAALAVGLMSTVFPALGWGALAGRPGNSGALYGNPILRRQQLICDPEAPDSGSSSVQYDPTKSTVAEFEYGPGYGPFNGVKALIAVQGTGTPSQLIPI